MFFEKYLARVILAIGFVFVINSVVFVGCCQAGTPIYLDAAAPINARVEDLLARMTLGEKVGQMNMPCVYSSRLGRSRDDKVENCRKFTRGTGTLLKDIGPGGGFFTLANEIKREGTRPQAEFFNELQKIAIEETRLKIPLLQTEEGTHGMMCPGGTIFPEGLAIGSTWNMELVRKIYATAAREARAVGIHQLCTLVIEPNRDPRHGRNEEGFSEDPYLCSRIAESIVEGAQGGGICADDKVVAVLCHFPGQTEGENGINRGAMNVSERHIREVFLPPWEAGVKKAGALGVMATHPAINGVPNHGSAKHLTKILRGELGFEGCVLSEGSNTGTLTYERVAATHKEAAVEVLRAGVDVDITLEPGYRHDMIENVKEGRVAMETIDRTVRRILRIKFLLGLFENPYINPDRAVKVVHTKQNQELARQVAREGIVLLKNENNLLPLDKNIKSIAVIGPNADDRRSQLGDYIPKKILQEIVTVLDGIKNKVSGRTEVVYVKGCDILSTDVIDKRFPRRKKSQLKAPEIEKAREAAGNADVAVVVIGENEVSNGESHDAADLDLTGLQEELVKAVVASGTPTVVVLINGRPLSIRWVAENVGTIVEAWNCGERGGNAIADVLFGDYNPSGRLPITIPRHIGQLPFYYNCKQSKANRIRFGYVTMPLGPLFEFGYGLSYTKFEYSNLQIMPKPPAKGIGPGSGVCISMDVKNAGEREGAEVVQLYINDCISSVTTPMKELKGFEKVTLEPEEKKTVEFTVPAYQLTVLDRNMKRVVEPGTFDVMVGASSEDIRLKGSFEIKD